MMKTTDTTTAGLAAPHPARETERQVAGWEPCLACHHLDLADTIAAADGVGWCQQYRQYRALGIERECESFRSLNTED